MASRVPRDRRLPSRLSPADRRAFTQAVLARTTGPACARARDLLGSRPDTTLESATAALLDGHLAGCDDCRAIETALADARAVLPSLVEVDPGPAFTDAVLQVTTVRDAARRRAAAAPVGWWTRLVRRPRFSLELAYVATILFVLAAGNPSLLAAAVAERAQALASGTGAQVVQHVERLRTDLEGQAQARGVTTWLDSIRGEVDSGLAAVEGGRAWLVEMGARWWSAAMDWAAGMVRRTGALVGQTS